MYLTDSSISDKLLFLAPAIIPQYCHYFTGALEGHCSYFTILTAVIS